MNEPGSPEEPAALDMPLWLWSLMYLMFFAPIVFSAESQPILYGGRRWPGYVAVLFGSFTGVVTGIAFYRHYRVPKWKTMARSVAIGFIYFIFTAIIATSIIEYFYEKYIFNSNDIKKYRAAIPIYYAQRVQSKRANSLTLYFNDTEAYLSIRPQSWDILKEFQLPNDDPNIISIRGRLCAEVNIIETSSAAKMERPGVWPYDDKRLLIPCPSIVPGQRWTELYE